MFKLKKSAVVASMGLLAAGALSAAPPVIKVTAHFADQASSARNDPKWLSGGLTIAQSFVPEGNAVSFLSANIFPAEKKQQRVVRINEKGKNLRIELKELQDGKPGRTVAACSDQEAGVKIGDLNLYRINAPVTPNQNYLLEFRLNNPGGGDYYFWYQYGGNPYPKGDFYMNGRKRGACDLDFAVYRPEEVTPGAVLKSSCPPDLLEISFQEKPDRDKTSIFLSGPGGVVKCVPVWSDDRTLFLGPLKLPAHPGRTTHCQLYVNVDGGQSPSVMIPFTLNEKN